MLIKKLGTEVVVGQANPVEVSISNPVIRSGTTIRYGTTAEWEQDRYFAPAKGELIIYTDYKVIKKADGSTETYFGLKCGDGDAYLIDLPFLGQWMEEVLTDHIQDTFMHWTKEDRARFKTRITGSVDEDETLEFTFD